MDNHTLTLSDGRALEVVTAGTPQSSAVVFHHGTPGAWNTWDNWLPEVESQGGFGIAFSRAGYGLSDRCLGRTIISNSSDTAEILKHFDVNSFVSIGTSGGGPHALADTTLPSNKATISIAGVGEYGAADLDFLADMGEENHVEFGAAVKGEAAITQWMEENSGALGRVTGAEIIQAFGGLIGEADKKALVAEVAENTAAAYRHGLTVSYYGWLDDDLAFVAPWGFEITAIGKPVELWQGDDDFMVPHAHGKWLNTKIPTSKLFFVPGEGHISLGENKRGQIIANALSYLR